MAEPETDFDLIVVGGGIAGLTAAVRALELGLRTLVLEQGEGKDYPCNTRHSGGILHIGFLDPYRPVADLTDIIARKTGGAADPDLAAALAGTGGRLLDWLKHKGARFVRFNEQEGYRWCMAPPRSMRAGIDWQGRGPDVILRDLADRVARMGGTFRLATRATGLTMHDGACVGISAESDGQRLDWGASHVLLADGGFQANRHLYEEYIGAGFDRVFQRGARTGTGDGLSMALAAGAGVTGADRFYGHVLCRDALHNDDVWPYPEIDAIATAGMVVDRTGARIVDEGGGGVHLANALATTRADGPFHAVFDAAIWAGPGISARIPANPLLEKAGGTVLRAETVEQLASLIDVSAVNLAASVGAYNAALAADRLPDLDPPRSQVMKPWPVAAPPFMAIPVCPGITYTMGGIAIDHHAQVLDRDGRPIPGLLAAGATTGGIEGGDNAGYIGGLVKSGAFGLIAAERVAALRETTTAQPDRVALAGTAPPPATLPAVPHGLDGYPMLRGIVALGTTGAVLFAALVTGLTVWLCWPWMGMMAIPAAALVGVVAAVVALSFVELVRLITELLLPQ